MQIIQQKETEIYSIVRSTTRRVCIVHIIYSTRVGNSLSIFHQKIAILNDISHNF